MDSYTIRLRWRAGFYDVEFAGTYRGRHCYLLTTAKGHPRLVQRAGKTARSAEFGKARGIFTKRAKDVWVLGEVEFADNPAGRRAREAMLEEIDAELALEQGRRRPRKGQIRKLTELRGRVQG